MPPYRSEYNLLSPRGRRFDRLRLRPTAVCGALFIGAALLYLFSYTATPDQAPLTPSYNRNVYKDLAEKDVLKPVPKSFQSSWQCTHMTDNNKPDNTNPDNQRSRMCYVEHFCVDRAKGGFLVKSSKTPPLNLANTPAISEDVYWQPEVVTSFDSNDAYYVDETLYVYGMSSPHNLNNWVYNGVVPLWRTMQANGATESSWLFRAKVFNGLQTSRHDMSFLAPKGQDIVLDVNQVGTDFQTLPPSKSAICFKKAVIGTGNTCPDPGCTTSFDKDTTASFRSYFINSMDEHFQNFSKSAYISKAQIPQPSSKEPLVTVIVNHSQQTIVNSEELVASLKHHDFNVQTFDMHKDMTIPELGYLMKDSTILIAAHGNALASAIFMPPISATFSINSRFTEHDTSYQPNFIASAQRYYQWTCEDKSCVEPMEPLARNCLAKYKISRTNLTDQAYYSFLSLSSPADRIANDLGAIPTFVNNFKDAFECYVQSIPRRVDVDKMLQMVAVAALDAGYVERLVDTGEGLNVKPQVFYDDEIDFREKHGYRDLCRAGRCCGPKCFDNLEAMMFREGGMWSLRGNEKDSKWKPATKIEGDKSWKF
ncbi:hypothetical protein BZG36_03960 [Bifiguratus adelaidae]|uniref:Glycosyltransferase 61 catalytic domain-containing protein n=1 Tax=Bifiguratus adelaidae TaxID=1938954 RepID=A0A261Y038_9FUNG|nr:hypothetical protein BZG36_03960 [Bifiguratus adelaidae]